MLCCGMKMIKWLYKKKLILAVINYARLGTAITWTFIEVAILSYCHDHCMASDISVSSEIYPLYEAVHSEEASTPAIFSQ